ncbi:unnamed protein product [Rotaria socialis]|uniref:Uncharacterized protein n=1 Tax=Rotaria socialis TaxID=392032 RepID=A0A821VUG9_9BILA|nr:unnamed protein product [Rotaria socialis]CAF4911899.1 unnamed protein product [Rotaria socialis]
MSVSSQGFDEQNTPNCSPMDIEHGSQSNEFYVESCQSLVTTPTKFIIFNEQQVENLYDENEQMDNISSFMNIKDCYVRLTRFDHAIPIPLLKKQEDEPLAIDEKQSSMLSKESDRD